MNITIYHNPRCSKSRKSLEILRAENVSPKIVAYLDTPPDAGTILSLAEMLAVPVQALVRRTEAAFRDATDLPPLDDDAALAAWLAAHPKVIERPIVVDEDRRRAVIGRPPETTLELLRD